MRGRTTSARPEGDGMPTIGIQTDLEDFENCHSTGFDWWTEELWKPRRKEVDETKAGVESE